MKPVDLSGLIKGLMVVIGIAMALGKLDWLRSWAMSEAFAPRRSVTALQDGLQHHQMKPARKRHR